VCVLTDGTAVLGLGDIGPYGAAPVMEGKCMLFKQFADIDAFPICLATKDVDEIVETAKRIAPVFGGVNREDIGAPRCLETERRLDRCAHPRSNRTDGPDPCQSGTTWDFHYPRRRIPCLPKAPGTPSPSSAERRAPPRRPVRLPRACRARGQQFSWETSYCEVISYQLRVVSYQSSVFSFRRTSRAGGSKTEDEELRTENLTG